MGRFCIVPMMEVDFVSMAEGLDVFRNEIEHFGNSQGRWWMSEIRPTKEP
jgi:hypothetical protein